MRESRSESFVCAECDTGMERVEHVPVLRSLVGHAVHRCGQCGHILLVQETGILLVQETGARRPLAAPTSQPRAGPRSPACQRNSVANESGCAARERG
jgi:hypothetical protein